jgi:CRP-like cAMP-binding protein
MLVLSLNFHYLMHSSALPAKMKTGPILENISKHILLNESEREFFFSLLIEKKLTKRELLHKGGDICRHSTFVIDGALKGYTIDSSGGEHVLNFAVADWWIADMYSLFSQKPGVLFIEALADSTVLLLSRENQELLYKEIPKFERFFRILIENALVANQQRLLDNLSLSAEQRYLNFMKKYPFVLSCAPLHSIASYLGITPEFLSKIRRNKAS